MNAARARRRRLFALSVLTIVVIAVVFGLVWKVRTTSTAAAQEQYVQLTQAPPTPAVPSVAFVGDSYSSGSGSSGYDYRFTTLVSAYEGWSQANFANGGTGYLRSRRGASRLTGCNADYCPNYRAVVKAVKASNPSMVFVSGGRNDVGLPEPAVEAAISSFYTSLRRAVPNARIIVTSPVWAYTEPPAQLNKIRAAVRASAARVGATYLDLGEPLVADRDLVAGDHVHPNNAGHAKLAQLAEVALSNTPAPSAPTAG